MKRGFTLVELLAVIVILAVIALITIPAVMKMIDNATINSYRRSIDLYGKAVSQGIISYESDMVEQNKPINITFENIDSYIEYEGNDVDCKDKTIYSDRTIFLTECSVDEELVYGEKGRGYGEDNYYYYTNSKKKMKLIKYIEAVEEAIQDKNISGTCTIGEDKITCNGQDIKIKSKLENAIEGSLTIENNKVKSYSNMKFATEKKTETNNEVPQVIDEQNTSNENNNQTQEKYATLVSDADNDGKVSIGDKYTYKVNNIDTFNFYVLSINLDNTVNLIMDRNICGSATDENASINGTIATNTNPCLIPWHSGENNNNYGPDTAMKGLYNATKNWINVPDMIMNYEDEYNKDDDTLGYKTIKTDINTRVTTITGKNVTSTTTIGTISAPLKARLPREDEVTSLEAGCVLHAYKTCSAWLVENLEDSGYSEYSSIPKISNIVGYWLLSSHPGGVNDARIIDYYGGEYSNGTSNNGQDGIRPVITVPMSYLTN